MNQQEQLLWDKAAIMFAAALMTREPDMVYTSVEQCVYEGLNMADMMLRERRKRTEQAKPEVSISLGVFCHECKKKEATKYYGYANTYPSCDDCFDKLNREFDDYEKS
jgi:hypothetical protein